MPQLDWSIQIKPSGTNSVTFEPQQEPPDPPLAPGTPPTLIAQNQDLVAWGNQTALTLQPWQSDVEGVPVPPLPSAANPTGVGNAGYICDPIKPGDPSAPQYIVTAAVGTVINYCCLVRTSGPTDAQPIGLGAINVVANF